MKPIKPITINKQSSDSHQKLPPPAPPDSSSSSRQPSPPSASNASHDARSHQQPSQRSQSQSSVTFLIPRSELSPHPRVGPPFLQGIEELSPKSSRGMSEENNRHRDQLHPSRTIRSSHARRRTTFDGKGVAFADPNALRGPPSNSPTNAGGQARFSFGLGRFGQQASSGKEERNNRQSNQLSSQSPPTIQSSLDRTRIPMVGKRVTFGMSNEPSSHLEPPSIQQTSLGKEEKNSRQPYQRSSIDQRRSIRTFGGGPEVAFVDRNAHLGQPSSSPTNANDPPSSPPTQATSTRRPSIVRRLGAFFKGPPPSSTVSATKPKASNPFLGLGGLYTSATSIHPSDEQLGGDHAQDASPLGAAETTTEDQLEEQLFGDDDQDASRVGVADDATSRTPHSSSGDPKQLVDGDAGGKQSSSFYTSTSHRNASSLTVEGDETDDTEIAQGRQTMNTTVTGSESATYSSLDVEQWDAYFQQAGSGDNNVSSVDADADDEPTPKRPRTLDCEFTPQLRNPLGIGGRTSAALPFSNAHNCNTPHPSLPASNSGASSLDAVGTTAILLTLGATYVRKSSQKTTTSNSHVRRQSRPQHVQNDNDSSSRKKRKRKEKNHLQQPQEITGQHLPQQQQQQQQDGHPAVDSNGNEDDKASKKRFRQGSLKQVNQSPAQKQKQQPRSPVSRQQQRPAPNTRFCNACEKHKPQDQFSAIEVSKPQHETRCLVCVASDEHSNKDFVTVRHRKRKRRKQRHPKSVQECLPQENPPPVLEGKPTKRQSKSTPAQFERRLRTGQSYAGVLHGKQTMVGHSDEPSQGHDSDDALCPECDRCVLPCDLDLHKNDSCPERIVSCPLCSDRMKAKDLDKHKEEICRQEPTNASQTSDENQENNNNDATSSTPSTDSDKASATSKSSTKHAPTAQEDTRRFVSRSSGSADDDDNDKSNDPSNPAKVHDDDDDDTMLAGEDPVLDTATTIARTQEQDLPEPPPFWVLEKSSRFVAADKASVHERLSRCFERLQIRAEWRPFRLGSVEFKDAQATLHTTEGGQMLLSLWKDKNKSGTLVELNFHGGNEKGKEIGIGVLRGTYSQPILDAAGGDHDAAYEEGNNGNDDNRDVHATQVDHPSDDISDDGDLGDNGDGDNSSQQDKERHDHEPLPLGDDHGDNESDMDININDGSEVDAALLETIEGETQENSTETAQPESGAGDDDGFPMTNNDDGEDETETTRPETVEVDLQSEEDDDAPSLQPLSINRDDVDLELISDEWIKAMKGNSASRYLAVPLGIDDEESATALSFDGNFQLVSNYSFVLAFLVQKQLRKNKRDDIPVVYAPPIAFGENGSIDEETKATLLAQLELLELYGNEDCKLVGSWFYGGHSGAFCFERSNCTLQFRHALPCAVAANWDFKRMVDALQTIIAEGCGRIRVHRITLEEDVRLESSIWPKTVGALAELWHCFFEECPPCFRPALGLRNIAITRIAMVLFICQMNEKLLDEGWTTNPGNWNHKSFHKWDLFARHFNTEHTSFVLPPLGSGYLEAPVKDTGCKVGRTADGRDCFPDAAVTVVNELGVKVSLEKGRKEMRPRGVQPYADANTVQDFVQQSGGIRMGKLVKTFDRKQFYNNQAFILQLAKALQDAGAHLLLNCGYRHEGDAPNVFPEANLHCIAMVTSEEAIRKVTRKLQNYDPTKNPVRALLLCNIKGNKAGLVYQSDLEGSPEERKEKAKDIFLDRLSPAIQVKLTGVYCVFRKDEISKQLLDCLDMNFDDRDRAYGESGKRKARRKRQKTRENQAKEAKRGAVAKRNGSEAEQASQGSKAASINKSEKTEHHQHNLQQPRPQQSRPQPSPKKRKRDEKEQPAQKNQKPQSSEGLWCNGCRQRKPRSLFSKNQANGNAKKRRCKTCIDGEAKKRNLRRKKGHMKK